MSKLLTAELNQVVDELSVVRQLPVPGRDDLKVETVFPGQLVSKNDIHEKSFVLGTKHLSDGQELAVVDKAQPHAVFDLMLISSGEEERAGLAGHTDDFLYDVLEQSASFGEFAGRQALTPVVAWSYDPLTDDRPTGQGEKRFHAHLMARTNEEMDRVASSTTVVRDLDSKSRRRIVEESGTVGGLVLYDLLQGSQALDLLKPTSPFLTAPSSVSLQAEIPGGWPGLADPRFAEDFRKIDAAIHTYDNKFRAAVYLPEEQGHWLRPELRSDYKLRADEAVTALDLKDPTAIDSLIHFLSSMKPGLITNIQENPNKYSVSDIIHLYPLRSVSYTTCITEIERKLMIHFRVNLFTDLGGAGTSLVGGIPVKIKKGVGTMTDAQLKSRSRFQMGFLEESGFGNV